jgi:hypothetical protein
MATTYRIPVESEFAWQQPVLDILADAPGGESKGDRYLVSDTPTPAGAFDGHADAIAYVTSTGPTVWAFDTPSEGWRVRDLDTHTDLAFDGAAWGPPTGTHTQNTDTGTTATDFTFDSDAVLGKIKVSVGAGAADKTMTWTNAALTDDRTITFPDAAGTVALTSDIPAVTGLTGTTNNTWTVDSDSTIGKIIIDVATGAADKALTITNEALTADVTATFPAASGSVGIGTYDADYKCVLLSL